MPAIVGLQTRTAAPAVPLNIWERRLWLVRAAQHLRSRCAAAGLVLPSRLTVTSGTTQVVNGAYALGECWPIATTAEGMPAIVIWDGLIDPVTILSTLLHELIHAADDCRSQHGPWFASWAQSLGLVGLPATSAGPQLHRALGRVACILGAYPDVRHGYVAYANGRMLA